MHSVHLPTARCLDLTKTAGQWGGGLSEEPSAAAVAALREDGGGGDHEKTTVNGKIR